MQFHSSLDNLITDSWIALRANDFELANGIFQLVVVDELRK